MENQSEKLLSFLDSLHISYETIQHEPLFTAADSQEKAIEIPGAHTKNLFLKDDYKNFWLISALQRTKIDLRSLSKNLQAKNLRFAQPEYLKQHLGIEPGSVTWFALFNDKNNVVKAILDKSIFDCELVGFHPLLNTATTIVKPNDLIRFVDALNHNYLVYDFT